MTRIDTTSIRAVANMLHDMLGDDFDDATFWDTLDGETDVSDLIDRLLSQRAETLGLASAAKSQATDLRDRAARLERRAKTYEAAMLAILDATALRKVERPAGTISRRSGSVSVNIVNADDVPSQLCRVKTEPDKSAIKRLLDAGEDVPGATLVRGDDTVTVRVK